MNNLVIVESPTKARTLSKFLGSDFRIEASMGHIRDLPKAKLGIDVEHNFEPQYIVPKDKKKRVGELKKIAEGAENIWIASDPDREGEAIAWHIRELFVGRGSSGEKNKKIDKQSLSLHDKRSTIHNIRRVEFHEITEKAVKAAFQHPREINMQLVDAQQARRVLDRLVGYKLSPLLWKKVRRGLSAGRVQSVTLRLVVEREQEIEAFKPVEYWNITATLDSRLRTQNTFDAELIELNGKKLEVHNQPQADEHLNILKTAEYSISKVTKREVKRQPHPPFTTSTLQQAAGNKLGFTAKRTMSVAQFLYEHGLITYMRTDSLNLSAEALAASREYIGQAFGKNYLPASSRVFKTKSKGAQEAHEAIRPTKMDLTVDKLNAEGLTRDHIRLYDLIWKRMIASQMAEAVMDQTSIDVLANRKGQIAKRNQGDAQSTIGDRQYTFRASGSIVKFDGWLRLYQESRVKPARQGPGEAGGSQVDTEENDEANSTKNQLLPELTEGEDLTLLDLKGDQHFTEPPPRYNEASLIKKLEELGIGRPSTYAPTLSTIQDRFYVEKQDRKFLPTVLGRAVTEFLLKNFADIIDYQFTALMELQLDKVADGEQEWRPMIKDFYTPFAQKVKDTETGSKKVEIATEKINKACPECSKPLLVRFGKFGKFLACSGFPECKHTEPFEEDLHITCPKDGGQVVLRKTKTGKPFYGCKNYPQCDFASWTKPQKEGTGTVDRLQRRQRLLMTVLK